MLVVLRPEAEQELLEAQAWYESNALGLGFEFARAADAAVASALRNPYGHLRIEECFYRVLFRKFPYTLIYQPSPNELLVVSFFHQHREPGVWLERFGS
ncbi:MAG: type II toxin-antitoxin system RelE/ParE family toxin [Methylobacter tundripaludum]|nr:type II toxin-antitoxin system RelE/ParE family toxin [Methylobacter tundripaludum]